MSQTVKPPVPARVDYVADESVDPALDRALRGLLTTCFTKPQDHVFQTRRYFNEPPAHRWIVFSADGTPVAHLAAHEKRLYADDGRILRIAGIAEVCVHPSCRGNGYVGLLLRSAHRWLADAGIAFAVLSGNPLYYASKGYRPIDNLFRDVRDGPTSGGRVKAEHMMAACLTRQSWPDGPVHIPGPSF